ncbi:MAG: hypothetical protein MK118_12570, partial [Dehalococcoidia bacterium]|nr:hypothetical protein [Dehalococcoidia bacterium]
QWPELLGNSRGVSFRRIKQCGKSWLPSSFSWNRSKGSTGRKFLFGLIGQPFKSVTLAFSNAQS